MNEERKIKELEKKVKDLQEKIDELESKVEDILEPGSQKYYSGKIPEVIDPSEKSAGE